jgi:hypothetical protein
MQLFWEKSRRLDDDELLRHLSSLSPLRRAFGRRLLEGR